MESEEIIFPKEGEAGAFRMRMYKGIPKVPSSTEFASDPGDYGRGDYWSDSKEYAKIYAGEDGEILEEIIDVSNVLRLSAATIGENSRKLGMTNMEAGHEIRIKAAEEYSKSMKSAGYEGVVVFGYESVEVWSICIFG